MKRNYIKPSLSALRFQPSPLLSTSTVEEETRGGGGGSGSGYDGELGSSRRHTNDPFSTHRSSPIWGEQ
ncbi:MAG: hypothetical protein SOZ67_05850 [Alloprevotella sp.]|uniref:hypothetical protein n=1 Tax=Prevotellamassilia timonensis TaxID=1852370 RepID=UPI001F23CC03|nr:hypothetical protein [Prevotellamassilia timonensis]MCI5507621.1 hypothetical protein [Bacteroidales bacterium]MDY2975863.1 hypothetical protein [Alloprevotella sp.]MCF2635624.1 hypothetical protein [Prevotellamassilia timonensis]MDD6076153.1 hypothetical protein [Bacteroidales bacterium]MDD6537806.1 hypothetical protein [Bacteroidales bacterium]